MRCTRSRRHYWGDEKRPSRCRGAAAPRHGARARARCCLDRCSATLLHETDRPEEADRAATCAPLDTRARQCRRAGRGSARTTRRSATWSSSARGLRAVDRAATGTARHPHELRATSLKTLGRQAGGAARVPCGDRAEAGVRRSLLEHGEPQGLPVRAAGSRSHGGAAQARTTSAESADVHFRFALGKAYEDAGDYDRALAVLPRRQPAAAAARVLRPGGLRVAPRGDRGGLQPRVPRAARGRGIRVGRADLHRRAAALRLDADRADPRQPQPGRRHARAADARRDRRVDRPLPARAQRISGSRARAARRGLPRVRAAVHRGDPDIPHDRTGRASPTSCRTTSRTSVSPT